MSVLWLPVLLVAGVLLIIFLWTQTGFIVAVIVFALLAAGLVAIVNRRRNAARFSDD